MKSTMIEWTGLYLFNNKHWGVSSSRALPISHATQAEIIPRWGDSEWFDTWADATQLKNKNDVAHSALLQTTPQTFPLPNPVHL